MAYALGRLQQFDPRSIAWPIRTLLPNKPRRSYVHGYSVKTDSYRLLNSWGRGWGVNGGALLRRVDMVRLLADGGEACVPVRTKLMSSGRRAEEGWSKLPSRPTS